MEKFKISCNECENFGTNIMEGGKEVNERI